MPESNRRHQAPEACALSAELIALKNLVFVVFIERVNKPLIALFCQGRFETAPYLHYMYGMIILLICGIKNFNRYVGVPLS